MSQLDSTDRAILRFLQQNGKMNVKEIAGNLNITKTPIYERINRLENEGIIDRYVAIVDKKKVGSPIIVFCSVSLDVQKVEHIENFNNAISNIPEVVECYLTGGVFDFLLKVIVKDLDAYHEFSSGKLAALSNVGQIKSSFVLNEVKYSTAFPISN